MKTSKGESTMRVVAALLLGTSLVTACTSSSRIGEQKFNGFLRSDTGFVTSPDRCSVSVLFDNYIVEVPAIKIRMPDRLFELSGAHGMNVSIDIRGTVVSADAADAKIELVMANLHENRDVHSGDPFNIHFISKIPAGDAPTTLKTLVSLTKPAIPAQVQIDSIDMAFSGGALCK